MLEKITQEEDECLRQEELQNKVEHEAKKIFEE